MGLTLPGLEGNSEQASPRYLILSYLKVSVPYFLLPRSVITQV